MRVQVNFSDDMIIRLDNYAKMFGVSRSSLISMLTGQGVMGLDKANEYINDNMEKIVEDIK